MSANSKSEMARETSEGFAVTPAFSAVAIVSTTVLDSVKVL